MTEPVSKAQTRRGLVIAAVMAAMVMVAIEATIVSTAMPQIAAQLGGLHLYSWVFSSFLLTQTAATVVFGKLSDIYGRRPMLLVGIAVFLAGSILCGFATTMPALIAFRLIQGVGAGAVQPVGITVVGDLYPTHERGKVQGYLASVWAVSAVLGPLVGGLIVRHVSWAWIFWINIPIGLAAAAGFVLFLHERVSRNRRPLDAAGAALFTLAITALMLSLTVTGPNAGLEAVCAFLVFLALGWAFIVQERRAPDPMIALGLWSRRTLAACNAAALLSGMALMGLTTFLPMYVQGVMGRSALVGGFALTAMVVGWPIGATLAARSFMRFGLRPILVLGGLLMPVGALAFVVLSSGGTPVTAGFGSLVMGFGMGLLSTASMVLIQDSVDWSQRGSATASNIFARNLGSTLGAAVLGAVFNHALLGSSLRAGPSEGDLRDLLNHAGASTDSGAVVAALDGGLHMTFWAILALSSLAAVMALLVPRPRRAVAIVSAAAAE